MPSGQASARERALGRRRRPRRPDRAPGEEHEERVALGALLGAAVRGEGGPHQLAMALADGRVARRCRARCSSLVEPSMSVNRNVTTPVDGTARRRSRLRPFRVTFSAAARRSRRAAGRPGPAASPARPSAARVIDRLEVPGREGEAARRLVGDDLGVARPPVEDRQLAEELAGPEPAHGLARRARHRREPDTMTKKPGPDLALAHDDAAGREVDLDGPVGDPPELLGFDALEQRRRGEQFGPAVARERSSSSCVWAACSPACVTAVRTALRPPRQRRRPWHDAVQRAGRPSNCRRREDGARHGQSRGARRRARRVHASSPT